MLRACLLAFLAFPAAAHTPVCETHNLMRGALIVVQGMSRTGTADAGGWLVEFWVAPNGDWAVTETHPDGQMCMIVMGEGYQADE